MLHRLFLPVIGTLLLLSQLSHGQTDADQGEVVRFNFRFGFFDDDQTPLADIMKEDVEGVLCQTQYFLSQLVQNATNTKSVHAKATEIDWGYYEGADLPAHVNFTVEFSDAAVEGDVNWVDDRILITEMEGLDETELQAFITQWVWKAEPAGVNFFTNANRMAFDGVKQAPVAGQLEEAECPETEAPTIAPTVSMAPSVAAAPTVAADNSTNPDGSPTVSPGAADGSPTATPGSPTAAAGDGSPTAAPQEDTPGSPTTTPPPPANADPNWPFGEHYNTPADLAPMADFSLSFAMFQDHENPPTLPEVNALMCQVNEYFTAELRRKLMDGTIHSKAVYIDYFFDEGGAGSNQEDIKVNFTAFAYYGTDEHDQVNYQDVFEAMKLTTVELKNFVEQYVWKSEPEEVNVFFHTESLGLNAGVGGELKTEAMLVEADGCVLPPNDDGTPHDGIPGPDSAADPAADPNADPNADPAGNPAVNPSDPNLGLGGDAKQTEIVINFRVSNLENIKEENAVKASGLDSSFPVFTNELVNSLASNAPAARRILVNGRRLRVVPIPNSASVEEVEEYPCPERALPGLTCHSARAKYDVLMTSDEDTTQVQSKYQDASERAANDGTYNNALQRVDPDTPLFIGIMESTDQIPPGSKKRGYDGEPEDEDDGWFKWWYILILLLLLLLCCLCCLYCWMLNKKDEPVKETIIEEIEREILVEEFDDEDVPPGHGDPSDEDEEAFVEDPDAAGVMVPYDPDDVAPVPAFDAEEKAHQDQAERDRILDSSQRDSSQRGESAEDARKRKEDDQVWEEDV